MDSLPALAQPAVTDRCVLLTGLSRGGTTLACELLNALGDVRALDEPMDPNQLVRDATRDGAESIDAAFICDAVERFADEQRRSIVDRGVALTLHVDGRVRGARVSDERDAGGLRMREGRRGEISMDPPASPGFTLVIKHPVAFTALLPILLERFAVFAIVRNPLAVLASWESVPFVQREGRLGLRPIIAPEIARQLDSIEDRLERQLALLDWFFHSYATHLPQERVIRYEDVVATGGAALAPIAPSARGLAVALQSRNTAGVYDRAHMREVARRLLERNGAHWLFYSPEDVKAVLDGAGG
jgi:hypothetical protein